MLKRDKMLSLIYCIHYVVPFTTINGLLEHYFILYIFFNTERTSAEDCTLLNK